MLYKAEILAICPQADLKIVDAIVSQGHKGAWERFGVTTPIAQAKFMGQIIHESANLTLVEENLRYSAKRLCQVWPKRFPNLTAAQAYANNPQNLANKVYGNRLGNIAAGDGYKFRGRGLKQVTGRTNYSQVGKRLGLDLIANPDLLLQPDYAFLSALSFWQDNIGTKGESASVKEITKIVNGGYNGLNERSIATERALDILDTRRIKQRELEIGNKGNDVRLLQAELVELGYKIAIDGSFGKKTADALKQFQDKSFLKENGIYDENTRLSLKLNLMEDRLKAAPVVEAKTDHQLKPNIQVDQEPLPDLPLDSVLTLTAQIALGMYGDIMGIERIELFDDSDGKLLKIKRLAMCLWAEIKQMGDFEGGNQALLNIESAVYWATQQAASKHNQ